MFAGAPNGVVDMDGMCMDVMKTGRKLPPVGAVRYLIKSKCEGLWWPLFRIMVVII